MNEKIKNALYQNLKERLNAKKVIIDTDILESYGKDESSDLFSLPDILVRAETTNDVIETMKICTKHNVPVIPRGAGSGVTGGAVPIHGGVVLSLEKMNKIIEIDKENMVAVVEPGVITGELQSEALSEGLMYPPDPASLDICSIGGNIAEIAGGPRAVKYGTTKDYVLGLECVLPDGSLINTGGKFVKNATGYNLTGIILGSEGTLAVITRIILRLIPAPRDTVDILIPYATLEEAIKDVYNILINRIVPATIEFMEQDGIILAAKYLNKEIPYPDAGAHLLIQIDGNSEDDINNDLEHLAKVINADADTIFAAQTQEQKTRLWEARRAIRDAIHHYSPVFLAEDCVVPRSKIPEYLLEVKSYLNSLNLRSIIFGHAGDGNVHIDILKGEMEYDTFKSLVPDLKKEIYKKAIKLGGTITGEHGTGCVRKDYLPLAMSQDQIELQKRIKDAFDPKGILNPGKVV